VGPPDLSGYADGLDRCSGESPARPHVLSATDLLVDFCDAIWATIIQAW
jgi:hypothetical protein